jgi:hypothetical protein
MYAIIGLVGLFLCFGYMTGSDWRAYELSYTNLQNGNFSEDYIEIGYKIYMILFINLGIGFWPFFIFTKFCLYLITCYFIKKHIPDNFYLAFAIYYCFMGIFVFIDNPMRYLIGSTIFLFSFKYILNKNFLKYVVLCLFAALFHKSFLALIFLYFFLNKSYKTSSIIIFFIALNILMIFFSDHLIQLSKSFNFLYSIDYKNYREIVSSYLLADDINDKQFSLGLLSRYLIFIILILSRKKIVSSSKYGNIAFNSAILTIYLLRFAFVWPIVMRIAIPLSVFYCVTLGLVVSNSYGLKKISTYSFLIIIYSGVLFSQITSAYKYIPYTSYLQYIGIDKPDYSYRDNYNYFYSPYKHKKSR